MRKRNGQTMSWADELILEVMKMDWRWKFRKGVSSQWLKNNTIPAQSVNMSQDLREYSMKTMIKMETERLLMLKVLYFGKRLNSWGQ